MTEREKIRTRKDNSPFYRPEDHLDMVLLKSLRYVGITTSRQAEGREQYAYIFRQIHLHLHPLIR